MAGRVLESNDNGGPTKEVFDRILNEHIMLEKEEGRIRAKRKTLNKKADDDGIDMAQLKAELRKASADPNEVIRRHNIGVQYARWLNARFGDQLPLIDELPDASKMSDNERTVKWRNDGWLAGRTDKNRDTCPHQPESPGFNAWMEGYEEAQQKNLSGIKGPDVRPVTEAAKDDAPKLDIPKGGKSGRRGRPPKSKPAEDAKPEEAAPPAPPAPPKSKGSPPPLDDDADWENADPNKAA